MSQEVETEIVNSLEISCDGGRAEGLGHPKVYLNLEAKSQVSCPYCGKLFIYKKSA